MSTGLLASLCQILKLPSVAREAARLAEEAHRQGQGHLEYLLQCLQEEVDERARRRTTRCLREAGFPRLKTLESFDFRRAPEVAEAELRRLAQGDDLSRAETVILLRYRSMGEPGTGKPHWAIALRYRRGVAAAEQGRRVRFVTAARLANELTEARDSRSLSRLVGRYSRLDLLVLDELGYLPLGKADAELLFQVLSERHEQRALVLTTNLPFAEWTTVFPDPRLCRALIDRLTHRAHILETGTQSVRLAEARQRPRHTPTPVAS
jgi:DNA replication protein DnaC